MFGFAGLEIGKGSAGPVGFVLARLAAGEAEILTLAVARSHRRDGLGWQLMDAVLRELHAQRAEALFLEVDETNAGAIAPLPPARVPRGRQAAALLPAADGAQIRRACHAPRSSLASAPGRTGATGNDRIADRRDPAPRADDLWPPPCSGADAGAGR